MAAQVLVQTAFLGDLLLSVPLLNKMRSEEPTDELILVCRRSLGDFFLKLGLVDHIFEVTKGDSSSYREVQNELRKKPSIRRIVSPHRSFRTALFLSSLRASEKVGFLEWWNRPFFSHRVTFDKNLPDAVRQLSLMAPFDLKLAEAIGHYAHSRQAFVRDDLGRLSAPPSWASMNLREQLISRRSVFSRILERCGVATVDFSKCVLLFPGSVWATKRWTEEGFSQVAQDLLNAGFTPIFMGSTEEKAICERLSRSVKGSLELSGETTVLESAVMMARSALVIANDSAPGHLAACAGTPLVSIFGPTIVEFGYRPWTDQAWVIESRGLECRPCGPHGHKVCPRRTHECMKNISASEVSQLALKILRSVPLH